MAANPVQQAHDLIDAYRRAVEKLALASADVDSVPEHSVEDDAAGSPLDTIADAIGHLQERIDLLRGWIALHVQEAA